MLLKPGKLTPDEWAIMKTHARLGADAIERAVADTEKPVVFLAWPMEIALHHQNAGTAAATPTAWRATPSRWRPG
jgi:putative two-component system response regulator